MAIKTIKYTVDISGVAPATEQFAGTQGDHRVTKLEFTLSQNLYDEITLITTHKVMYRFDVYDGEGGIWQSEAKKFDGTKVGIELEERHTRYAGKITVYLVITALSQDNETEMELYSFPSVLRLKNRPDGTYQDGENHESVVGLVEIVKANAEDAASYSASAQAAELSARQLAAEVEQKLTNGEYKGEKGDTGPQGPQGDKGKDAATDQTYSPTSENAQSGVAVAEAVNGRIPKPEVIVGAPIKTVTVMNHNDYTTITHPDTTQTYIANDTAFEDIIIDDGSVHPKNFVEAASNCLATRDSKGNLWTGAPIDDQDCTNKAYVDGIVGNIETALDNIIAMQETLIGGDSV